MGGADFKAARALAVAASIAANRGLSRIAQLDQRTVLPDQCLLSAEADVRPSKEEVRFDRLGHGA